MMYDNDLFASFARSYDARRETEMSLSEYLEGCRSDPMMYAGAPERIPGRDRRAARWTSPAPC